MPHPVRPSESLALPQAAPPCRLGLTLTEVLLVLGILGVILCLGYPTLNTVRAQANAAYCSANLRQAYLANQGYSVDWNGVICPSSRAFMPASTVEMPWPVFVAPYADKSGIAGISNGDKIPTVAVCKALWKRFPDLLSATKNTSWQIRGWGYARNAILMADSGNCTGPVNGASDWSNWCTNPGGIQGAPYYRTFRWNQLTQASHRLFIGEGYYSAGSQVCSCMTQTGVGVTAANIKYQYTYQWASDAYGGNGYVRTADRQAPSPDGVKSDVHQGRRSAVMCDGSVRRLSDSYLDANNQLLLSIINPSSLP